MTHDDNPRFYFTDQQKNEYAERFKKAKPRLESDRIKFFLTECEREITWCLRKYPRGWSPTKKTPAHLKKVANAAIALRDALAELDQQEEITLFAGILLGSNCHEQGYEVRQMQAELRETNRHLTDMHREALELISGDCTPINQRFADDLAGCIARCYAIAFKALPSVTSSSIYTEFVAGVAINDVPEKWRLASIGRRTLGRANTKVKIFLDVC